MIVALSKKISGKSPIKSFSNIVSFFLSFFFYFLTTTRVKTFLFICFKQFLQAETNKFLFQEKEETQSDNKKRRQGFVSQGFVYLFRARRKEKKRGCYVLLFKKDALLFREDQVLFQRRRRISN